MATIETATPSNTAKVYHTVKKPWGNRPVPAKVIAHMRRLLIGLAFLSSTAFATVHYKLTPMPSSKSILVSITIDAPRSNETFHIPAWCPGYYQIAQYQQKIFDAKAADDSGQSLQIEHIDPRAWKVQSSQGKKAIFSYKVMGDDPGLGFFGVNVGSDKTFVNGAGGFMYVEGRKTEDVDLTILNPAGWDVATAMDSTGPQSFKAGGYDEFIDHPIQLGVFQRRSFKVMNVPFETIFVSQRNKPNCNVDAETERLRIVSGPALKMFGASSFKRYLYIIHLDVGNFSGGLEHRACNVQAVSNTPELHLDDLAAHEYFHAWNVKQIRPEILGPFDYTQPQRTANLWFAEGVTDYYSKLHTYQSGLRQEPWLRAQLLDQIQQLQQSRSRKTMTVEEASRQCWDSDGFGSGDLSYYVKGLLAGFIFDAAIIDHSDGKKTLDDVMRLLYKEHKLPNPGYGEDELRLAINQVAGADLSELYRKMIRSTEELPYSDLQRIGLRVAMPDTAIPSSLRSTPDGTPERNDAGFALEVDPLATERAKSMYRVWLHRLNGVK